MLSEQWSSFRFDNIFLAYLTNEPFILLFRFSRRFFEYFMWMDEIRWNVDQVTCLQKNEKVLKFFFFCFGEFVFYALRTFNGGVVCEQ